MMRRIVVLLIFIPLVASSPNCLPGYVPFKTVTDKCYRVMPNLTNWVGAIRECWLTGGSPINVASSVEMKEVLDILNSQQAARYTGSCFWSGLNAMYGDWQHLEYYETTWRNNSFVQKWGEEEGAPNSTHRVERNLCASIDASGQSFLTSCGANRIVVCESWVGLPIPTEADHPSCGNPKLSASMTRPGVCYFASPTPLTFRDAQNFCSDSTTNGKLGSGALFKPLCMLENEDLVAAAPFTSVNDACVGAPNSGKKEGTTAGNSSPAPSTTARGSSLATSTTARHSSTAPSTTARGSSLATSTTARHSSPTSSSWIWLPFQRSDETDKFRVAISDPPLNFTNWRVGEPSKDGRLKCAAADIATGKWFAISCESKNPIAVCYVMD